MWRRRAPSCTVQGCGSARAADLARDGGTTGWHASCSPVLAMRPLAPARLRLVREGTQPGPVRAASRWRRLWIGAVLCLVAAGAIASSRVAAGRRAARSMPDEERAAIFVRALGELKQSCRGRPRGLLEEHCRELASFLAQFDECGDECEALVRDQLAPHPTR